MKSRKVRFSLAALGMLLTAVLLGACGKTTEENAEEAPETEAAEEEEAQAEEEPNDLEKNSDASIDRLIEQYFACLSTGDVEALESIVDVLPDEEKEKIQSRSRIIEGYENVVSYTKRGPEEGSYIVFACYDMKLVGTKSSAPGIVCLYVSAEDGDGNRKIHYGDVDETMQAYVEELEQDPEVQALYDDVSARYQQAQEEDETLAAFLQRISGQVAEAEPGEETEEEAGTEGEETGEESAEEGSSSEEGTGESTAQNRETKLTTATNIRKEPSTESERLTVGYMGEAITQVESYDDGWSKVIYNGVTGYVKTEYLE